jgi:hypothetical protein
VEKNEPDVIRICFIHLIQLTCITINQVRKSEAALLAQNAALQKQLATLMEAVTALEACKQTQAAEIALLNERIDSMNKSHAQAVAQLQSDADARMTATTSQFRRKLSDADDLCQV